MDSLAVLLLRRDGEAREASLVRELREQPCPFVHHGYEWAGTSARGVVGMAAAALAAQPATASGSAAVLPQNEHTCMRVLHRSRRTRRRVGKPHPGALSPVLRQVLATRQFHT